MPNRSLSASAPSVAVVPLPAEIQSAEGRLEITGKFAVAILGARDARLDAAVARALRRWEERTGLVFPRLPSGPYAISGDAKTAALTIEIGAASPQWPRLGEDESYTLDISAGRAVLKAATTVGAQRGLETLLQLLQSDAQGWFVPALSVRDHPRFPWRGLMIDVCRRWQPVEVIKRNLDGMALAKLNVFHFHLSEDQGFRIESKKYPRLQQYGSDGLYFTQDQIREILAYAADRGIRVVPEFDIPGHAQSWVVGYPELASAPGPYVIERNWGVFDPVLDPTKEETYQFLEGFLGEMAALFPDEYFHIGGDENNGVQWSANPRIQAFIKEHNLKDNEGLHAYFNRRVQAILAGHGKKLVGWDEILHPELPKSAAIQSWRGAEGLAAAARAGHPVLLSNGYYIDQLEPASVHYLNDPLPAGAPLSAEERKLVLGGEATMWAEWVSPETIDSRIWPRTAAIAERLWSPSEVADVPDLYRRLDYVSRRLSEAGLRHIAYREPMLLRYAGDRATPETLAALRELIALGKPILCYTRTQLSPRDPQYLALTTLADCMAPDPQPARVFVLAVEDVLLGHAAPATLEPSFASWRSLASRVKAVAQNAGPRAGELSALADQLAEAADCGAEIVARLASSSQGDQAAWYDALKPRLAKAEQPQGYAEIPMIASLRLLAAAAREQGQRGDLTPEAWRAHLQTVAFPKKNP